jgi:hypothetical protein
MTTASDLPLRDLAPLHGMRVLLVEDCGTIGLEGALQLTTFVRRALGATSVEIKASAAQAQKRLHIVRAVSDRLRSWCGTDWC